MQMVKERLHESFLALALGVRLFLFKVCHFVAIPLMSSYYIIYIYIYIVEISPDHACLSSPGSPSCRNIPAQGALESLRKRPSLAARRIAAFDIYIYDRLTITYITLHNSIALYFQIGSTYFQHFKTQLSPAT